MNLPDSVRRYLDDQQMPYRLIACTPGESLVQIAAKLDISLRQMVRIALLKDDAGLLMTILPCNYILDFSRLCQVLQRELEPLYGPETTRFFQGRGCASGSHPPLPAVFGVAALADDSLLEDGAGEIYFDGGSGDALVGMRGSDFCKLLKPVCWEHFAVSTIDLDGPAARQQALTPHHLTRFTHRYTPSGLREGIEAITELPAMPQTAQHILALRDNQRVTLQDILPIVARDPSLAAQVVYCARSPLHGHHGAVDSLETAIGEVLGVETTLNLLLGASMGQTFQIPADGPVGLQAFWRHSVYCAALVSELVKMLPDPITIKPGLAYLGGLLHDFGYLVLGHALPARFFVFNRFLAANHSVPPEVVERYVLGVEHWHIGAWLMQSWNMPDEVIAAVRWHHSEDCTEPHAEYANLVLIANRLLPHIGLAEGHNNRLPALAMFTLGLTRDQAHEALARVESSMAELDTLAEALRWPAEKVGTVENNLVI